MKKEGDIIIRDKTGEGGPGFWLLLGLLVWFAVYLAALDIGNKAVEEEPIHQQLEEHGVTTHADIKECSCSSRSYRCNITYQYQVASFGLIINHYGRDVARYDSDCKKGQVVRIKYLPENPDVSKLEASYSVEHKQKTARPFTYFSLFFISLSISYLINNENTTEIKHQQAIGAVNSEPTDSIAWLVFAHILEAEGERAKAHDCYEKAFSITLPSVLTTLQSQTLSLLPSMVISPKAQTNKLSNRANSSRPQLVRLSRMTKLPILLIVVLAWSKFFSFLAPLVEILELISISLLILSGVYFMLQIFPLFKLVQASFNWLEAKAVIIGSYIELSHGPKKQETYQLYIASTYEIKDKPYYSLLPSVDIYGYRQLYFNSGRIARTNSEPKLRDIQKKYPVGQVVTVYYNPQKPELVTDRRGFHPQINTVIFQLANLALFCWLFAYLIWVIS